MIFCEKELFYWKCWWWSFPHLIIYCLFGGWWPHPPSLLTGERKKQKMRLGLTTGKTLLLARRSCLLDWLGFWSSVQKMPEVPWTFGYCKVKDYRAGNQGLFPGGNEQCYEQWLGNYHCYCPERCCLHSAVRLLNGSRCGINTVKN